MGKPLDSRILSMIVHDLRTPLGVLKLSLRIIDQQIPKSNSELLQDLQVIRENLEGMERMLNSLADYGQLLESRREMHPLPFDPRALVRSIVEWQSEQAFSPQAPLSVEVQDDCPAEVQLDERSVRSALQYALRNTLAASNGQPIRVRLRSTGADRWAVEFRLESPPPATVAPVTLRPDCFERLSGIASNRLGLELAIVSALCEQLGGSARLETEPNRSSSIVLDWPRSTA